VALVRHPIFLCVTLQQTFEWHVARQDPTWDDATSIRPKLLPGPLNPDGGPYFRAADRILGLGAPADDAWREPLFQIGLLPTLGHDAQGSWFGLGMFGSEPVAWGPLVASATPAEMLCHWRVTGEDDPGTDWTWNYGAASSHPPVGYEPTGEVVTTMSAWRVFAQSVRPAGSGETYPAKAQIGPQPWAIRDHAWLAREILAGTVVAAGDDWREGRADCYDMVPIGGPPSGVRPSEFRVGFQVRMTAATFNGVSALVRGLTHYRPLAWSQYARGFDTRDLDNTDLGWSVGAGVILQPYGCAYVYGRFTETDAKLDGLGIVRRATTSAMLQALRGFAATAWTAQGGVELATVPPEWLIAGDAIEWCSHDDIHQALAARGFAFDNVRFVQPVLCVGYGPAQAPQSVAESFTLAGDVQMIEGGLITFAGSFAPPVMGWQRINVTFAHITPDSGPAPELQMRFPAGFVRLVRANPVQRAQVHFVRTGGPVGTMSYDVTTVGPMTGIDADSIERFRGEFRFPPSQGTAAAAGILWAGRLLGRAGSSADVMAVPWRWLVPETRTEDRTGPRTLLGQNEANVPLVLPSDTPRAKALRVMSGGTVSADSLETSTWPDHYGWELYTNRPDLRLFPQ
jgi:hypothetical protein